MQFMQFMQSMQCICICAEAEQDRLTERHLQLMGLTSWAYTSMHTCMGICVWVCACSGGYFLDAYIMGIHLSLAHAYSLGLQRASLSRLCHGQG